MISHYVVQVIENGTPKYLFRHGILVNDQLLAKPFFELISAKRYFLKSNFVGLRYAIVPVSQKAAPPAWKNLSSIVE